MFGLVTASPPARRDYSDCSGCSLCFLVCPMWRASRDPRLTPEGIAKALQCGATASQLSAVLDACCLCGACDPVCPERIDLPSMIMELRRRSMNPPPPGQPRPAILEKLQAVLQQDYGAPSAVSASAPLLMPGPDLRGDSTLLTRVQDLLGLAVVADDGADIALALEAGVEIPPARIDSFLATLRGHSIVVENGLLSRQLRRWIPGSQRIGLGAALNGRPALRARIGANDLYVIDARAYHADHERMVAYYDRLRIETGCTLNLDLQRIAIPLTAPGLSQTLGLAAADDGAQAKWILRGRQPARIVVETLADRAAFQRVCDIPVVHLADLAQN